MGISESRSLTETGLKYISRYLILHFSIILCLLLFSTILSFNQENLLSLSASKLFFVIAIIFLFILVFMFLVIGLKHMINGRLEFSDPHESNVILATSLLIIYMILYFINLTIAEGFTGGTAFIAAASCGFSSSVFLQFFFVVVLSVNSHILLGFSLILFVKKLATKKQIRNLRLAYLLLILGTLTINITALIAYLLFFKIYRNVYQNVSKGIIKPALVAPCPKCSYEIPIESRLCMFCGAKFEKKIPDDFDRRLYFNVSKSEYKQKQGYFPMQGLNKEEKKKFLVIVGFIIVSIIIGFILIIFF
ncbi:MAG: hypothetical protein ACQXXF_04980 [Thermoplasmatota archaeon]